jgi:mono/diheme cytochrome c family protein
MASCRQGPAARHQEFTAARAWRAGSAVLALDLGFKTIRRGALAVCIALQLSGCGAWLEGIDTGRSGFDSTFQKHLARAESGNAESQNAVGYMLYHGEGAPMDRAQAQMWFQRAADRGNARARRNLALMAAMAPAQGPVPSSPARLSASGKDLSSGEHLYLTFCSGCHGVNGISAYEHSPSFAFGERLEKGDAQLMRSLREGMQEMPGWDGKLTRREQLEVLSFIRGLGERYETGIGQPLRATPDYYYLFGPMEARRLAAPVQAP